MSGKILNFFLTQSWSDLCSVVQDIFQETAHKLSPYAQEIREDGARL